MAVSVEALPAETPDEVAAARRRRQVSYVVFASLAVLALVVGREVPGWLDLNVQKWAQDRYSWAIVHRQTSPLFTRFFTPLSDALAWSVEHAVSLLDAARWPGVVALTALIGWRTGGRAAAVGGSLAMLGVGMIADWDHAMITLSIMLVAVGISLVLGVPLGIAASRSDRTQRVLRLVLDTAQVLPIFVYFSPVQVGFGIGFAPAVVVTVIYALPPAVRLTNLGLRNVPVVANEVGQSFGATSWQQLMKVQLPIARRAILLGLNQVIMMAFAIVVLASLLGTGDLGQDVLSALQKQRVGAAAAAGLGIVLLAVALDRISTAAPSASTRRTSTPRTPRRRFPWWAGALGNLGCVVGVALVAHLASVHTLPTWLTIDIASPIDSAVNWVNSHLRGITQPLNDAVVTKVLEPLKDLLVWLPWLVVVLVFAFVGWLSRGWRLAGTVAMCLVLIAMMGSIPGGGGRVSLWDLAMDTLSQVLVAIVISVAIALPLGILAGRSDRVERVLRPFLDIAQVLPQFVYLIPVVFLFSIGRGAGVVACVVYAVPPCIRLTAMGMREVPYPPREAAVSFGATRRQEMRMVQLPLARKAILLGINQTLLMVLATVIIAALVGAGALGLVAYEATAKPNLKLGQGVAGGVSIVLLAIMLDRITQAWGTSKQGGNQ